MSYQALYRVWRSQRFDTIVGQKMVTQTLKNAIIQNKTSHAYLFTGPRGTGKTSAAKIFAKAINCPNNQEGEPCNACDICLGITEGRLNDVIEIDAASNNGVEEIRDIREKVKYAPTQATYKVYIIDEVHMLSTGAFNALLKTLEEPPSNVIFILATTEPHKIPATIISRTQRFDFKRIDTADIVEHLAHILKEMDVAYQEQSLYIIARAAEGGMRDALSIMDQALSFADGEVTVETALQVTGSLTAELMDQLLKACQKQETETAIQLLHEITSEGKESSRILDNLLLYCRDLLMYQQAPNLLANQNGQATEIFKELAESLPATTVYHYIDILSETQKEIRFTNHPDIYLEVGIVKMATASTAVPTPQAAPQNGSVMDDAVVKELTNRVAQLETALKNGAVQSADSNQGTAKKTTPAPKSTYRIPTERVYQVLGEATRSQLVQVQDAWDELLQMVSVTQRAMLKASQPVAASSKAMVLSFDYEIVCQRANEDQELHAIVLDSLQKIIQYQPNIVCIPGDSWTTLRNDFINQRTANPAAEVETPEEAPYEVPAEEEQQTASENAIVDEALDLFGDSVTEVIND
ncbi:DNA polymerase III subunit gamma/tau [Vagococcus coleopterorum]|uniref:DNA-directed DNA polymerase n=1 Tax=Vagococcus coleopterorum TaxID=2714946 RepID=A0A6G8AN33_9ENTE|nr:DNA polymerase III subunit gamma/tau [Vagococcus coleopterorum]QIL46352.1 DNA polymerase III subunit gamma/tau [Vagococcus coleopterorum]